MTNRFYLSRFFNVDEYANFIECLREQDKLYKLDDDYDNDIINESFTWSDTAQGSGYWSNLHEKLAEEDDPEIYKNFLKLMII